jgi:hypothetical protein
LGVLGIHPWRHCKQLYSSNFTLKLPCKFFYDSKSLTNILPVILSGHIERHLITPSPFLLSPVISVHHITGLPRVHTPT